MGIRLATGHRRLIVRGGAAARPPTPLHRVLDRFVKGMMVLKRPIEVTPTMVSPTSSLAVAAGVGPYPRTCRSGESRAISRLHQTGIDDSEASICCVFSFLFCCSRLSGSSHDPKVAGSTDPIAARAATSEQHAGRSPAESRPPKAEVGSAARGAALNPAPATNQIKGLGRETWPFLQRHG